MKSVFLIILIMSSFSLFARDRFFAEGDYTQFCNGAVVLDDGYQLDCQKAFQYHLVKTAQIESKNLKNSPQILSDNLKDIVFDYRLLPDDSTDLIYFYVKNLRSKSGSKIGYAVIRGIVNSEMSIKLQVFERYNLKGEVITVSVRELN